MNPTIVQNDLSELMAQRHAGPFVSIYLPTRTVLNDLSHQRLQFQRLIKEAKQKFSKRFPKLDFSAYHSQFDPLLNNSTFWLEHTAPQTGFIASATELSVFDLSHEAGTPTVTVSSMPAILPILADRQRQQDFELLCLNEDNFKWYHYRQNTLHPVALPEAAPTTLKSALGDELRGGEMNFNSSPVHGPSYHGHNAKSEEKEVDQRNYYQLIDAYLLENFSAKSKLPVVLFALPHNQASYRKISKNPYLSEFNIAKSPRRLAEKDLLAATEPIQDAFFAHKIKTLVARVDQARSKQLIITDPFKLIRPALEGRLEALLINQTANVPGTLSEKGTLVTSEVELPDNLMDDLADVVLTAKGEVHLLANEQMPIESEAIGILRF